MVNESYAKWSRKVVCCLGLGMQYLSHLSLYWSLQGSSGDSQDISRWYNTQTSTEKRIKFISNRPLLTCFALCLECSSFRIPMAVSFLSAQCHVHGEAFSASLYKVVSPHSGPLSHFKFYVSWHLFLPKVNLLIYRCIICLPTSL